MKQPNEKMLTLQQVAKHFDVTERTVQFWVKRDNCPHLKLGGVYRFYLSEVMAWARARGAAAPTTAQTHQRVGKTAAV